MRNKPGNKEINNNINTDDKINFFTLRTVGPQAPYCASRSSVSTRRNSSCWARIDFWISKCLILNHSWNSLSPAVIMIGL